MDETEIEVDLSDAEIYVVADRPEIAQGRWHIKPDDTVFFERDTGEVKPAMIPAHTLRGRPTWTKLPVEHT